MKISNALRSVVRVFGTLLLVFAIIAAATVVSSRWSIGHGWPILVVALLLGVLGLALLIASKAFPMV
jgi:hypothetical protein